MTRLSQAALAALPPSVARPAAARAVGSHAAPGVVHLGVGNFHRAHQALAFDDLIEAGDARWGVCGVSLKRPAMRDALAPQDGLYSLLVRDGTGTRARVVGALRELLVAPQQAAAVLARLADARTRLVTLTITEKGYDETGPGSALAVLLAGLAARRAAKAGGVSLLSCDNLAGNGERLRERLLRAAASSPLPDSALLARWIDAEVVCPNSMVDRIVPSTTDADREAASGLLGMRDAWPVVAEPFSQWVLEHRFAGDPPPLARVGVQLVTDAAPWEAMKLRMLNAAHSAMAYLGAAAGLGTVDVAVAEPRLRAFIARLWQQVQPTLPPAVRAEAPAYANRLMARFANPALGHSLLQISMDGSRKLPQRLVSSLIEARREGLPHDAMVTALAAWMRFLEGVDDLGRPLPLDDPLAARLRSLAVPGADARGNVSRLLRLSDVFEGRLHEDATLVESLSLALTRQRERGALAALTIGSA